MYCYFGACRKTNQNYTQAHPSGCSLFTEAGLGSSRPCTLGDVLKHSGLPAFTSGDYSLPGLGKMGPLHMVLISRLNSRRCCQTVTSVFFPNLGRMAGTWGHSGQGATFCCNFKRLCFCPFALHILENPRLPTPRPPCPIQLEILALGGT